MVVVPGYQILETLYESPRTLVLRGQSELWPESVVLKILKADYPTLTELLCYRNHYTLAKALPIPGVVKALALLPYRNSYVLVLEDCSSQALSQYVQQHPIRLEQGLKITLQLVDILQALQECRVIHKKIEPANILIHPNSGQVKLTDFSIASLLPRETQTLKHPSRLEGTLAYLSPEQTGRMNRGIDYRSDFYSLGVTLYELFTGCLPFTTPDPVALLHSHIAQHPRPPHELNSALPLGLSALILKLMAKMAEDRYQSTFGLRHDLQRCLESYQTRGLIPRFALGTQDRCDRFQIPEKLYGRETEAATLLAAFERLANHQLSDAIHRSTKGNEIVLISGFSGIGKTALVNEIHKPILRQQGLFIKGKFDQLRRNIPLSALIQAFQQLLRQLLTESSEALSQWHSRILNALGSNGQVITAVLPALEQIIGPQPAVPELSPSAAQRRFIHLFGRFMQVFASPASPLVIFLDDLQWADTASLSLIHHVMAEEPLASILLIGAYRDNEVSPAHPLKLTIQAIQKQRTITEIQLGPLEPAALNHLVAETLHCSQEQSQPLTHWVMQKTQGNPFFATQFLRSLHADGLITFNRPLGYWQCDLAQIQRLSMTPDVVAFMATQLGKLPDATQTILKLAACLGNEFKLDTLALVCHQPIPDIATQLWPALQLGMILPISDIYRFFQAASLVEPATTAAPPSTGEALGPDVGLDQLQKAVPAYRFLHDRVQQAAYSLIPPDQKPDTHLKIGRLLWQHTGPAQLEERIFEILNALNQGYTLIQDPVEAVAVAQLNLTGGLKAKEAIAYDVAASYLQTALQLLPSDSWQSHYDLTLALHDAAAEVAYLRGTFKEMEQQIQAVLDQAQTLLHRINAYEVRIQAYTARNQPLAAVAEALAVLKQLGVKLPLKPTKLHLLGALIRAKWALWRQSMPQLVSLPTVSDPTQFAIRQIMRSMSSSAYNANPNLIPLLVLKAVEQSIYRGHSPDSAYALAAYGVLLCGIFEDFESGYQFGQAGLALLERFNAQEERAKTLMVVYNFVNHWKQPLQAGVQGLLEAYQVALETGDTEFAAFNIYLHCYQAYCASYPLATLETDLLTYSQTVDQQFNQIAIANLMRLYRQVVLNLMGQSADPCHLLGESYDEQAALSQAQTTHHQTTLFDIHFHKLILNYLFGRYAQAVACGEQVRPYLEGAIATPSIPLYRFYDALACLGHYPQVSAWQRQRYLRRVHRHLAKLRRWSRHGPTNLNHKVALIEAELHRLKGRLGPALDAYDRAIAQAKAQNFLQEQALANELAARCLLTAKKPNLAQVYLIQAYYDYARWGANAKVDDLQARYPELLQPVRQFPQPPHYPLLPHTLLSDNASATLDLASVIKTSQALSQPLQRYQLLSVLMKVVLETAGAARGILILAQGDQLQVTAEIQSDHLDCQFTDIPLDNSELLPKTVVYYVQHLLKTVVINDASVLSQSETPQFQSPTLESYSHLPLIFQHDPYLLQHQPKSILCAPIHHQGQMIGLLYLENSLVAGAFTDDRLTVLQMLTAQAAISLRNTQLYEQLESYSQTLEAKVAERTRALEQEIRDRNAIANALKLSEEKFSKAFHATPNPLLISRLHDGMILEVNNSFCQESGFRREEVIGQTSADLNIWVLPQDRSQLLQQLSQPQGIHNQELLIRRKDGELRTALVSIETLEIEEVSCLLVGAMDITERKRMEDDLQQAKQAAEAASREKSNFLSRMSHELRTPLTTILGFTQLMGADPSIKTVHQEQLNIIEHSSQHLLTLIQNILTMSKIEAGQVSLDCQKVNLHQLLSNLQDMMQLRVNSKGLALTFDYKKNAVPQWIQADEVKLNQILINLLSNAIKFTDQGKVTLEAWVEEKPLTTSDAPISLYFAVEDTGPGISATEISHLFQPFYQAELGRYTQEGSGLGLSISKSFVELMEGEITVSSHPHQNTRFQFYIPVTPLTDLPTTSSIPETRQVIGLATGQPSYRILVAEDDRLSQAVMKRLLTSVGFQVKQARNGEEAIMIWQQWHPHLIWMDMRMPGMNGHEATQRIREMEASQGQNGHDSDTRSQHQSTKIIALTANAFDEDRLTMLSVGCDDFISKPFLRTVILDKLAEHLGVLYRYQSTPTLLDP